jgi:hypothetical protein
MDVHCDGSDASDGVPLARRKMLLVMWVNRTAEGGGIFLLFFAFLFISFYDVTSVVLLRAFILSTYPSWRTDVKRDETNKYTDEVV